MLTLFQAYELKDIIVFLIILTLAAKELVSFINWVQEKIHKIELDDRSKVKKENRIDQLTSMYNQLTEDNKMLKEELKNLSQQINLLVESDMDDIKSYLTERHHKFCYIEGWIDDYSLECCERRFKHYKDEGGNSFILNFMNEMRALPKQPPESKKKQQQ